MIELYRALLRIYPPDVRDEYGEDLIATALDLHDGRFSLREAVSLAANGVRQRALASTAGSARATWLYAVRLAVWFSLLNWLSFRLLNAWQAVRLPGQFAGRDRMFIGEFDVAFPVLHPEVSWTPGEERVWFALALFLAMATVAVLLVRSGPVAAVLALFAGAVPSVLIETTAGDALIFLTHALAVGWFVSRGFRARVLAPVPVLVFVSATALFSLHIGPRTPRFEHMWGVGEMVALGFGWALFTFAALLLVGHDPRLLPISAAVYAVFLLQLLIPAIGDAEIVSKTPVAAGVAQAVVLVALAGAVATWGNRRLTRV